MTETDLVDLAGHTAANRLGAPVRSHPVQANWSVTRTPPGRYSAH